MKTHVNILSVIFLIFFAPIVLLSQSGGDGWYKVFSISSNYTYAIKTDGSLWVLSSQTPSSVNFYDGDHIDIKAVPQQINTEKWKIIEINLRLKEDGTMWCQDNQSGWLGDGTDKDWSRNFYKQIGNENDWSYFDYWSDYGQGGVFAIKENGTLWAWGINTGTFGDESIPITKNRQHPQPITQIGTENDWKTVHTGGSKFDDINAIALKTDGSMWGWGDGDGLGLNLPYNGLQKTPKKIIEGKWSMVSRGQWGTAAIRTDGTLWIWAYDFGGSGISSWLFAGEQILDAKFPEQYGKETDWQTVSIGSNHILAIKTDGTLWSAGMNSHGEVGNGSKKPAKRLTQIGKDSDWEKIFAGDNTSFAIKKDGSLWSWGDNIVGGLGHGPQDINDKESQLILIPTRVE